MLKVWGDHEDYLRDESAFVRYAEQFFLANAQAKKAEAIPGAGVHTLHRYRQTEKLQRVDLGYVSARAKIADTFLPGVKML